MGRVRVERALTEVFVINGKDHLRIWCLQIRHLQRPSRFVDAKFHVADSSI